MVHPAIKRPTKVPLLQRALESQMVQSVDGARTDLLLRLQIHHHGVSGIFPQPGLFEKSLGWPEAFPAVFP